MRSQDFLSQKRSEKRFVLFLAAPRLSCSAGFSLVARESGGSPAAAVFGLRAQRSACTFSGLPLSQRQQGTWASVVGAPGPSCPGACGIFPDHGWDLCPLRWQAGPSPLEHPGNPWPSIVSEKIEVGCLTQCPAVHPVRKCGRVRVLLQTLSGCLCVRLSQHLVGFLIPHQPQTVSRHPAQALGRNPVRSV